MSKKIITCVSLLMIFYLSFSINKTTELNNQKKAQIYSMPNPELVRALELDRPYPGIVALYTNSILFLIIYLALLIITVKNIYTINREDADNKKNTDWKIFKIQIIGAIIFFTVNFLIPALFIV